MGWITDISCGKYQSDDTTTILSTHIQLTDHGFKYVPIIIDTIYNYIDNILSSGIKQWIYEEQQKINLISYKK